MRIIFNLMKCGLGNNGGSQTIIKTANKLAEFGNDVKLIDTIKNKFTWSKLEVPHILIKNLEEVPDADAVIATGYGTVEKTLKLPDRCGIKYHWIRGWEVWCLHPYDIINTVFNAPTIKIVNGLNMYNILKKYGHDSVIIRPGVDDDLYFENGKRKYGEEFIIGGLYHTRHKTKNSSIIIETVKLLKQRGFPVKLYMFGNDKRVRDPHKIIDKYISQPTPQEKNELLNQCHLWFAPTINDSLHSPPMEAMLTNCPTLAFDHEMNGMKDYLRHGFNSIVMNYPTPIKKIAEIIIKNVDNFHKMGPNCRKFIIETIGNRDKNVRILEKFLLNNLRKKAGKK